MAEPPSLPKSLEWYLEGVKWLVIIAAALIAFGVACLEKTGWWPAYLAFGLFAPLLGASCYFGVLYLFHTYHLAGLREKKTKDTDQAVKDAQCSSNDAYRGVVWTFPYGVLAFAIFGGIYVWDLWVKHQAESPSFYALAPGTVDQAVLRKGDAAWILTRRPDGSLYWRRLALK